MIRFQCPTCSFALEFAADAAGSHAKCPRCREQIRVPRWATDQDESKLPAESESSQERPSPRRAPDEVKTDEGETPEPVAPRKKPPIIGLVAPVTAILRALLWTIALADILIVNVHSARARENLQLIEYIHAHVFTFCLCFAIDRILVGFADMSDGFRRWRAS